jgi:LysR family transcriptional regulator, cell division regulator
MGFMDIADLRVFEAVARVGGMSRAAVELHTVQSNITARIKALEADISCPLFERRPRGVALTAAGRRLLPYAVRTMRMIADARRVMTDRRVAS